MSAKALAALLAPEPVYGFTTVPALSRAFVANTLAALRATAPTTGSPLSVLVLGNAVPGDGGGGAYSYNPTDVSSPDNGGSIIVSSDGGRWYLAYPWK